MGGAFGGELALHEQEFVRFPLAKIVVAPAVEVGRESLGLAYAADGEVRMELAFLFARAELVDGGLEGYQAVEVAGEPSPDHARITARWKAAHALGTQLQSLRKFDQGAFQGLDFGDRHVAKEFESEEIGRASCRERV